MRGDIQIRHLDTAALGRNARMFHFLQSVAMTADLSASFAVEGAHLLSASFSAAASGSAVLVGIKEPVQVRSLHLAGRYDRATSSVHIDDATLDSDQLHAHIVGKSDLVRDDTGAITRLGIELTADNTALSMPGTFAQAVTLPMVSFHGGYVPATHDILIDKLETSGGPLKMDTSGHITLVDNQSPVMEVKGRIETLSVRDLLHYWPLGIGEGARQWIDANIFAGQLGPLVFETHLAAGALDGAQVPDGAVLMTFPISGGEVSYVTGLTHMTALNGTARLTGNTFGVDIASARIGPLAVTRPRASSPT